MDTIGCRPLFKKSEMICIIQLAFDITNDAVPVYTGQIVNGELVLCTDAQCYMENKQGTGNVCKHPCKVKSYFTRKITNLNT